MQKFSQIFSWVVAVVFLFLYVKECNRKCPVCPVCPEITGGNDTGYVPAPIPVAPKESPSKIKQSFNGTKNGFKLEGKNTTQVAMLCPEEIAVAIPCPLIQPNPSEIANDYVNRCPLNNYIDTMKLSDAGVVVVKDSVRGTILKRSFTWSIKQKPIPIPPKSRFYVGIEVMGIKSEPVKYIGFGAAYQGSKSPFLYSGSIGSLNQYPAARVGIYLQLNK